ncbi:ketohexokinase [Drosophila novamexicana]|uniref:ketohexokinase n=1 Tax=Drosophila novamexicana TaxID=47314 RepID=UPI0011E5EFCA|nr:ketohexokinase [Drosophila novamexicana]
MDEPNRKLSWAVGKKTVLCVGYSVIDCISIVRRFPRIDEIERSVKGYWQRGGNAANTCTVLRNLGVDVEFFGVLSSAPMFSIMLHDMKVRGIKIDNCPRSNQDPPFSSVIVNKSSGTCTIVNCNNSFPYPTLDDFKMLDLSKYGWIHFRGNRPEITTEMMQAVEAYNATQTEKIVISVDMDGSFKEHWPLVDYCEYAFFYRQLADQQQWKSPREACISIDEHLAMRFGINLKRPLVVVLWNLQNVGIMDHNSDYHRATAYRPKKFVDSLGATEVFVGAFIYAVYVRERSHQIAANFANLMASYKCIKCGFDHISDILMAPVL